MNLLLTHCFVQRHATDMVFKVEFQVLVPLLLPYVEGGYNVAVSYQQVVRKHQEVGEDFDVAGNTVMNNVLPLLLLKPLHLDLLLAGHANETAPLQRTLVYLADFLRIHTNYLRLRKRGLFTSVFCRFVLLHLREVESLEV